MARTFQMNRFYPAPGGSSKVDGFNINLSGDAEFQAKLLQMGPLIVKRAMGICRTFGEMLAQQANAAAPRGKAQKGRPGGYLSKSFKAQVRPQWMQLGKVGVAVRSVAKYHHYVEFGVNKPDTRVIKFRTDAGKKVAKGKRYRDGTIRLRDGVRVSGYVRDIQQARNPFFGEVIQRNKSAFEAQAREGLLNYIGRLSAGDAESFGSSRTG
jgi:hypothetical protein